MHDIERIQYEYRLMYGSFLRELKRYIRVTQPCNVVVIGFGNGPELPFLAKFLPTARIVAVDNDECVIVNARRRLAAKNIFFVNADMQSDSVQNEFRNTDLIVGFFVLHLLNDSERVSSKWYDITPPHTNLLLADWCAPDPRPLDGRWFVSATKRYEFEASNPENIATSGAALRIAVKV